mmetsp:Transcript_129605/g.223960  ORF Transcript_129605/g.223960 Transcript_129605/m.223960 type:complete len:269 (+) Transcript_129605:586-1392(+)
MLAVSAPRGKELHKDVLAGVHHNTIKILRGQLHNFAGHHWLSQVSNVALERFQTPCTTVSVRTRLVVFAEHLQRGEPLDAILAAKSVVFVGVHLSNDRLRVGFGQCLPCRGQVLAVSAPWGKELHEDVLAGVHDDLVEVLRGQLHNFAGLNWLSQVSNVALEGFQITATVVVLVSALVGFAEHLQSGETSDFKPGPECGMLVGVHLSNDRLRVGFGQCLPCRGQVLAVSAPWGKELHEDVLAGVHDDLVEVLRRQLHDLALRVYRIQV